MNAAIASTLALLQRAGIPYCLLHGWEHAGEGPTGDVDLAVRRRDVRRVERLIDGLKDWHCVQKFERSGGGFYFVLASFGGAAPRFWCLDLATEYRHEGKLYLSADELLRDRRLHEGIWLSSEAVEFSYLLIKKVLKGFVPHHQRERLELLAGSLGPQAAAAVQRFFGRDSSEAVCSWLARGDWKAIQSNLTSLKAALRRCAPRREPWTELGYWLVELARIWRRWRRPTGLCIAVLGPDGSGKSTLIERLPAIVGPAFRRCDAFHLRPGLLPAVGRGAPVRDPHSLPPRNRLFSIIKLLYLVLDYALGYWLKVRPKMVRSSLVLFDRYFQDLLVDPRRYRYGGPKWLLRSLEWLVPKPDLFLLLDVPEHRLLARKKEVPLAEAGRQRSAYRRLAAVLPNAVVLDGAPDEKRVQSLAAETVLRRLRSRRRIRLPEAQREAWDWLFSVLRIDEHAPAGRHSAAFQRGWAHWRLCLRDGRAYLFPLSPRIAAASLRLYNAQSLKARTAKRCLAFGLAAGILQPLLPRPPGEWGEYSFRDSLLEHLSSLLGGRDLRFAVSLGTPGPHRKPVVQALDADGGTAAFAKIGWDEATCALVANEARALLELQDKSFESLLTPRLLHFGPWRGRLVCLQSAPPANARRLRPRLDRRCLQVLLEVACLDFRRSPIGESPFGESLKNRIFTPIEGACGAGLGRILERILDGLKDVELPFPYCHGDFVPWNALEAGERLFLFDWEYARRSWLPGYDLFHFLVQTRLLLSQAAPARILRDVLESSTSGETIEAYWRRLEIEPRRIPVLFLLYLLERLSPGSNRPPVQDPALQRTRMLLDLACAEAEFGS